MQLTLSINIELLIDLSGEQAQSPEEFLLELEEKLESNELTIDEVREHINAFNSAASR